MVINVDCKQIRSFSDDTSRISPSSKQKKEDMKIIAGRNEWVWNVNDGLIMSGKLFCFPDASIFVQLLECKTSGLCRWFVLASWAWNRQPTETSPGWSGAFTVIKQCGRHASLRVEEDQERWESGREEAKAHAETRKGSNGWTRRKKTKSSKN